MRVIGGEFGSRRLKTTPGMATRPTPDRLREALFNILTPRLAGAVFVDAYAGSGSVGIEALSRGAARAVFVESRRAALVVLNENLASLGLAGRASVIAGESLAHLARVEGDIFFLDPPYNLEREYTSALEILGRRSPALVIIQHSRRLELPEHSPGLERTRLLRQGDNALSFYRSVPAPETE